MKKYTFSKISVIFISVFLMLKCGDDGGSSSKPASVPAAPLNISATAGNKQVAVAWDAVAGADSYALYWKNSAGVTVSDKKIEDAASPYAHSGLRNGVPYYYAVAAVNSAGESSLSAEVSATPQQPLPGVPSNVKITAGNCQATISWDAVAGADSYNIYWKNSTGVTTSDNKITGAISPYMHSGLTNALTYCYAVTAVNASGESGLSSEVSATPKMPAGMFTKSIAAAGAANGSDLGWPDDGARYMMLYLAEDIKGSGIISSISFRYYDDMSGADCSNVTIKMGHTDVAALAAEFADNVEQGQGSLQTVVDNASIAVPDGAEGNYYTIALSRPFNYNGLDNLVIEIIRAGSCTGEIPTTLHLAGYNGVNYNIDDIAEESGTVLPAVADIKLNFAGGDDVIYASGSSNYNPFNNFLTDRKVQLLYRTGEINGSGLITGIAFPIGNATFEQTYTINVRMGHTDLQALTDTFDDNFNVGNLVIVADAAVFSVPAGVPTDDYIWIPVPDALFNYNGINNLVVEIEVTATSGNTLWRIDGSGIGTRLSGANGASTGSVDNAHYGIKFRFAGGTADVLTSHNDLLYFPFSGDLNNKQQFLYRAAELGTKGSIIKVAYRLANNSVSSAYGTFAVVLGNSTSAVLADPLFSGNMTGAQTVYSGTVPIPDTLKAGDWIEIPLDVPFVYDGVSNLVVQTSSLLGTEENLIWAETNAAHYINRRGYAADNTTDTLSGTDNILADIRLETQ